MELDYTNQWERDFEAEKTHIQESRRYNIKNLEMFLNSFATYPVGDNAKAGTAELRRDISLSEFRGKPFTQRFFLCDFDDTFIRYNPLAFIQRNELYKNFLLQRGVPLYGNLLDTTNVMQVTHDLSKKPLVEGGPPLFNADTQTYLLAYIAQQLSEEALITSNTLRFFANYEAVAIRLQELLRDLSYLKAHPDMSQIENVSAPFYFDNTGKLVTFTNLTNSHWVSEIKDTVMKPILDPEPNPEIVRAFELLCLIRRLRDRQIFIGIFTQADPDVQERRIYNFLAHHSPTILLENLDIILTSINSKQLFLETLPQTGIINEEQKQRWVHFNDTPRHLEGIHNANQTLAQTTKATFATIRRKSLTATSFETEWTQKDQPGRIEITYDKPISAIDIAYVLLQSAGMDITKEKLKLLYEYIDTGKIPQFYK